VTTLRHCSWWRMATTLGLLDSDGEGQRAIHRQRRHRRPPRRR
jgi:hypothetical protein